MKCTPRILALMSVVVLLSAVLIVPALAAPIDYNDYVTDIQVDGDNDLVTVTIPAELAWIAIHDQNGNELYRGEGEIHDFVLADFESYSITICPFGYPWNYQNGLDLLYIPKGTQIATGFGFDLDPHGPLSGLPAFTVSYEYAPSGDYDAYSITDYSSLDFVTHTYVLDPPDDAELMYVLYRCGPISPIDYPIASIYVMDTTMVFTISSLLRQQQATGKTNAILKEVEKQLADQGMTLDDIKQQQQQTNDKLEGIIDQNQQTNDKLDDIINGGSAGEDLIDKNDQLTDIGDDLKENMDQIQDFEDQYFGQFEDNLGDVVDAADISFLYVPLGFVQRYLNKIVAAIPSKYLVVFTLPMLFGLFLYIVGHPVRAPRPDPRGDTVTRETFTQTQILEGPHAGRVTSTRTVTTSSEIGRVHKK